MRHQITPRTYSDEGAVTAAGTAHGGGIVIQSPHGCASGNPIRTDNVSRETSVNRAVTHASPLLLQHGKTPTLHTVTSKNSWLRAQHLRDMLAAISEWHRATGAERSYWRGYARLEIARFRTMHLIPERRAFERDVAARKRSRPYLPGVV